MKRFKIINKEKIISAILIKELRLLIMDKIAYDLYYDGDNTGFSCKECPFSFGEYYSNCSMIEVNMGFEISSRSKLNLKFSTYSLCEGLGNLTRSDNIVGIRNKVSCSLFESGYAKYERYKDNYSIK